MDRLTLAQSAAREAGGIVQDLRGAKSVSRKSDLELVTQADVKAQEAIVGKIRAHFPEDLVYGEESAQRPPLDSDALWVIDPLDGTNNYVFGAPHYSVSIAFARKGIVEHAVVFDPCRDELFAASKGSGAACNGAPIHVSSRDSLKRALVIVGFYYDRGKIIDDTLAAIGRLFEAGITDIRRTGSAALDLCWIACGRCDAYFEYKLSPWDYAAGWLVCTEAGGKCAGPDGTPMRLDSWGLAVTNGPLHEEFVRLAARRE